MPSKVNDCSGSKAPSFLCSPSLMDWWHTGAPPDRSPWYAFISGNYIISSSSSSYSRCAVGYVSLPLGLFGNLGIYVQFALDRTKPRTAAASRVKTMLEMLEMLENTRNAIFAERQPQHIWYIIHIWKIATKNTWLISSQASQESLLPPRSRQQPITLTSHTNAFFSACTRSTVMMITWCTVTLWHFYVGDEDHDNDFVWSWFLIKYNDESALGCPTVTE